MSQVYREYTHQVEDTNDSPTPVMDRFYLQGDNTSLTTMKNLTLSEFESIWAVVDKHVLDFEMKAPMFEKMTHRVIGLVEPVVFPRTVPADLMKRSTSSMDSSSNALLHTTVSQSTCLNIALVMLKKSDSDLDMPDNDMGVDRWPTRWVFLSTWDIKVSSMSSARSNQSAGLKVAV
ncbi:hypothetical protein H257_10297 [Aphanomyces astaci]|uniref:Uncharacterized protein n=1 Tax=Aphanomyces astaci TaxID=112090 RepID=W4G837_APHAT|nr:hypothetical protein H257_10297 [Aphanomyces astaci]ETV75456.1 hypothetical protein H257_10297 [Aphanomyces astaci]|eukprot:XP_009835090.1 hypothetical protein H257_10297 [Aphanomyces astaci]